jgi:hypothetical protein
MKIKSSPRYGVRHIALVNSGRYLQGVFPLHGPLSIAGRNNLGKTQALESLQFLMFDQRHCNFGAHDLKTSRAFFFPSDNSYVLMEVWLPDGIFIIGAHGKGAGSANDYELFVAKSELDMADFSVNGMLRPHKSLFEHWATKGVEVLHLSREEMRQMLFGEFNKVKHGRWDVTLVPLANASERRYQVFRQVYRNLLTQQTLRAKEFKDLILNIFSDHLSGAQLNFLEVKDKAFRNYNLHSDEILRLENRRDDIIKLCNEQANRDEKVESGAFLRRELSVNLRIALQRLPAMIEQQTALLNEQRDIKAALDTTQSARIRSLEALIGERGRLAQASQEIDELTHKTSLTSRESVESSIARLNGEHAVLSEQIAQADEFQVSAVTRKIEEVQRNIKRLEQRLKALKSNNHIFKGMSLGDEDKRQISRLVRPEIFTLPASALTEHEPGAFQDFVSSTLKPLSSGMLHGAGFDLDLSDIEGQQFHSEKPQDLEDQIKFEKATLTKLSAQMEVATNQDAARLKLVTLAADLKRYQGYLHDYDRLEELTNRYPGVERDIDEKDAQLAELRAQIDSFKDDLESSNVALLTIEGELKKSRENQKLLSDLQRSRHIQQNFFGEFEGEDSTFERDLREYDFRESETRLDALAHAIGAIDLSISSCRERIMTDLPALSEHTESSALAAKAKERLDSLPQMREMQKRYHAESIAKLSGALSDLATNFQTLEYQVNQFNKRINTRQVSNLRRISINIRKNEPILDSIGTLLEHLANTEATKNDLFSVETANITNAELNRAMDRLTKAVEDGRDGNLELCDLFELSFGTTDVNGKELVCENLDELASTGSAMTLKPLLFMSMIRYLTDRSAKDIWLPFYIDEVAQVDDNNQKAILGFCSDMAFTPVFSSVDPSTTVDYSVNLAECLTDDNRVYVTEADWVRYEHRDDAEGEPSTEEQMALL